MNKKSEHGKHSIQYITNISEAWEMIKSSLKKHEIVVLLSCMCPRHWGNLTL